MARKETPTRKMDKQVEERMKKSGRIGLAESKKAAKKPKRFKFVRGKSGRLRAQLGSKRSRAPMPSGNTYRIRRGDTLSGIAKRLGTTVRKLMALNPYNPKTGKGIKDPNKIRAGAMLNIRGTKPSVRSKAAKSFAKAMKKGEKLGKEIKEGAGPGKGSQLLAKARAKGMSPFSKRFRDSLKSDVTVMPEDEKGDKATVIDEKKGTRIVSGPISRFVLRKKQNRN